MQTRPAREQAQSDAENRLQTRIREFLNGIIPTDDEVTDWLSEKAFPFSKYDAQLGYVHRDRIIQGEGINNSACIYNYEQTGERVKFGYRNRACRINTYGNSFTSCEQVNDGETWQEALAAQLEEPVRNFGVGGYSVYLTYLRMLQEETKVPAEHIIFNVFDDDHFRNLISWQRITSKKGTKSFHPTTPYVKVNPSAGQFVEFANPCPSKESVYNLCKLDWVYDRFKDDFVLGLVLARSNGPSHGLNNDFLTKLASRHGLTIQVDYSGDDLNKMATSLYAQAGLFASMRIIEKAEAFARAHRKKVLYVLSAGPGNIAKRLNGEPRFDQPFVDFLKSKRLSYVDLMETHVADLQQFSTPVTDYIGRYFVGHYNPQGNLFYANTVRNSLVAMLEPKPVPYR